MHSVAAGSARRSSLNRLENLGLHPHQYHLHWSRPGLLTEDTGEAECSIRVKFIVDVELRADILSTKRNLMFASDPVDIVRKRKSVNVEMGGRTAVHTPFARHTYAHADWIRHIHADTKSASVDASRFQGATVVAPSRRTGMERVNHMW